MAVLFGIGLPPLVGSLVAYIGPGPGLGMIGALIGLVVTVITAIGAVLLWPLRALLKKMGDDEQEGGGGDEPEGDTPEAAMADGGSEVADAADQPEADGTTADDDEDGDRSG
jgi:hypothetical protein